MSNANKKFEFTWRIDRFHMLPHKKGDDIHSPTFLVERFSNTKWFLTLSPGRSQDFSSENFVSCYLCRSTDDGPENITIEFDLSINSVSKSALYIFKDEESSGFCDSFKRPDGNICIVSCCMRRCDDRDSSVKLGIRNFINVPSFKEKSSLPHKLQAELISSTKKEIQKLRGNLWPYPKQCFARTIVSVETRSIACRVDDITCLQRSKLHVPVLSCSENLALLVILQKTEKGEVEDFEVNICFVDKLLKNVLLVCKMETLGNDGEVFATQSSHLFENSKIYEIWKVESSLEWHKIQKYKNATLTFDFSLSDGSLTSSIEYCRSADYESVVSSDNLFPSDLLRLYTEKKFFDVTLQASGKTFEAHKTVLCAKSPVFEAMFESDMKESITNNILIDDMDSHTINQMLTFLYSGNIVEPNFAEVIKLFSAGDKYQIVLLKNACRKFLLENLTFENVISVVSLAYAHHDRDMKNSAADFIYENAVFLSQKWKQLCVTNPHLALEIYQYTCSKYL